MFTTCTATPRTPSIRTTPYPAWWHPHKTLLDCVLGWIFAYILPLYKVSNYPATKDSTEAMERIQGFRVTLNQLEHMGQAVATNFRKWSTLAGSPIAEVAYRVPRRPNLLNEWGRTDLTFDNNSKTAPSSSHITVRMFFPLSLLSDENDVDGVRTDNNESIESSDTTDYGCKVVELADLSRLPSNVPLVVYFHGGGGTMGEGLDSDGTTLAVKLVEKQTEPIILASVEYSLAPEHPFPTTNVEAIAVLSHFIETNTENKRPIHVAGSSAGGYLAIMATMECLRHYPVSEGQQRVKSVLSCCPMLDPACDSQSYFECSKDPTRFIEFARWSWQAILELPSSNHSTGTQTQSIITHDDALAKNSNRAAWNECEWKGSSLEGLVKPIVDVPKGLDEPTAPTIIITTNRADALYTEGVEYAAKLGEKAANITHLDHSGCHWVGTSMNPKAMAELISVWRKAIFD